MTLQRLAAAVAVPTAVAGIGLVALTATAPTTAAGAAGLDDTTFVRIGPGGTVRVEVDHTGPRDLVAVDHGTTSSLVTIGADVDVDVRNGNPYDYEFVRDVADDQAMVVLKITEYDHDFTVTERSDGFTVATVDAPPTTAPPTTAPPTTVARAAAPSTVEPDGATTFFRRDYARNNTVGPYGADEFSADWGRSGSSGIRQGRAAIGRDAEVGTYLRMTHPGGEAGVDDTGVNWQKRWAEKDNDTVWISYDVMLEDGWSWGSGDKHGGKLGGIMLGPELVAGGKYPSGAQSGDNAGGSVRFTWKNDGRIAAYVYHVGQPGYYGDVRQSSASYRVGEWMNLAMRVELNTPGKADGRVQLFLDGEQVLDAGGFYWRDAGTTWGATGFMHSFFHGGKQATFAPKTDSYSRVANITAWSE